MPRISKKSSSVAKTAKTKVVNQPTEVELTGQSLQDFLNQPKEHKRYPIVSKAGMYEIQWSSGARTYTKASLEKTLVDLEMKVVQDNGLFFIKKRSS